MKNNKTKNSLNLFFTPIVLFLILCILIVSYKIVEEIKKPEKLKFFEKEKEKIEDLLHPEIEKEVKISKPRTKIEKKSKVAIIIDDIGWNLSLIKEIEEINKPLTLAILPKAPYSLKILNDIKNNKNFEFILHLPLEPSSPAVCNDKGLIKVNMDKEEIEKTFEDNVKDFLPFVKGVNNHMGSLYTINEEKMEILLSKIKEKNLFFVDSLTNSKSCGYRIAKELGIKTTKRDIFLDISNDSETINSQIDKLIELAKEKGKAIGIGHARKTTLEILKNRISDFEKNSIELVTVSNLLE